MTTKLHLQAGGTLNPRQHLYVERTDDEIFFRLLLEGQYVNVLTSRQMGKSSLMMRTVHRLERQGARCVTIDLASELGRPHDLNAYYLGLLNKVVRVLSIEIDLKAWWNERNAETVNQRLLSFFREVSDRICGPVVIFLDEIDSTLGLPYSDDLFTAIRGMYNERPIVEAYRRMTFCLLGVATPNELIKSRRTTAYNVGTTIELRDFDKTVDDLSPFASALNASVDLSEALLDRVLYWSGGQPYLTQKFCADIANQQIEDPDVLDALVNRAFKNLDQASHDIHFEQILRFLEERLSDEVATIELYAQILKDGSAPDRTTLAHAELKLSGLVKRDHNGKLIVRNLIYRRLFDQFWIENTRPKRALAKARGYAMAASVAVLLLVGGGAVYYTAAIRPEQQRLYILDRLAQRKVAITTAGDGSRAVLPRDITPALLREVIPILKELGSVTEIGLSEEARPQGETARGDSERVGEIHDLSEIAELNQLRRIKLSSPGRPIDLTFTRLEPLTQLTNLRYLDLVGVRDITSLEPLRRLKTLVLLYLSNYSADITSLEPLESLTNLSSTALYGFPGVTSLEPLHSLTSLSSLLLFRFRGVRSLEPLRALTNLTSLELYDTSGISSLEPLRGLPKSPFQNLIKGYKAFAA